MAHMGKSQHEVNVGFLVKSRVTTCGCCRAYFASTSSIPWFE